MPRAPFVLLLLLFSACSDQNLPEPWTSAVHEREIKDWRLRLESFRSDGRARRIAVRLSPPSGWAESSPRSEVYVDGIWCEHDKRSGTYHVERAYKESGLKHLLIVAHAIGDARSFSLRMEVPAYDSPGFDERTDALRRTMPDSPESVSKFLDEVVRHGDPRMGMTVAALLGRGDLNEGPFPVIEEVFHALEQLRAIETWELLWPFTGHDDSLLRSSAIGCLGTFMHKDEKSDFTGQLRFGDEGTAKRWFQAHYSTNLRRIEGRAR